MITIVDVAAKAGVSVATVSRVLNNSYAVTEEKKNLVMKAIEETGYIIPPRMKIYQSSVTKNVILVITGTQIGEILDAIQSQAASYPYQAVTYSYHSTDDFDNLKQLILTLSNSLAGIILLNAIDASEEFYKLISAFPVVQIGEPLFRDQLNYTVYNDEITMCYDATDFLIRNGKKKPGLLMMSSANQDFFATNKREKGFFLALLEHQMEIDYTRRIYTDVSVEGGYEATLKLLELHPDIDCIVCASDAIALGCLHALLTKNILSTEVEPFSLDYNEVWELFHPYLPYIDPHHKQLGSASVQMLHSLISGEEIADCFRIIPHELVTSSSVKFE